jgi:hypothetical protein
MLARFQVENDKSVAASQTANTKEVDLEPCRKFSLLVVPNATHTYGVKVNFAPDIATGVASMQEVVIPSASQGNVVSAIIECKADVCSFAITNGDGGAAHTYDVYIHRIE